MKWFTLLIKISLLYSSVLSVKLTSKTKNMKLEHKQNYEKSNLSEDTLENEAKSIDLRYNDLLNVFGDKYQVERSNPQFTDPPIGNIILSKEKKSSRMDTVMKVEDKNIKQSTEEIDLWENEGI